MTEYWLCWRKDGGTDVENTDGYIADVAVFMEEVDALRHVYALREDGWQLVKLQSPLTSLARLLETE